jgi:hypothetical protein
LIIERICRENLRRDQKSPGAAREAWNLIVVIRPLHSERRFRPVVGETAMLRRL